MFLLIANMLCHDKYCHYSLTNTGGGGGGGGLVMVDIWAK